MFRLFAPAGGATPLQAAKKTQRRAARARLRLPARLRFSGGTVTGESVNVSTSGVLVHSRASLPGGDTCGVILEFPEGAVQGQACVVRRDPTRQTVALEFRR